MRPGGGRHQLHTMPRPSLRGGVRRQRERRPQIRAAESGGGPRGGGRGGMAGVASIVFAQTWSKEAAQRGSCEGARELALRVGEHVEVTLDASSRATAKFMAAAWS